MLDRTNGTLDAAIVVYRDDPSEENRAFLIAAQRAHAEHFYAEQTGAFIDRTKRS